MRGRSMSCRFACLLELKAVKGGSASSSKICIKGLSCRMMFSRLLWGNCLTLASLRSSPARGPAIFAQSCTTLCHRVFMMRSSTWATQSCPCFHLTLPWICLHSLTSWQNSVLGLQARTTSFSFWMRCSTCAHTRSHCARQLSIWAQRLW